MANATIQTISWLNVSARISVTASLAVGLGRRRSKVASVGPLGVNFVHQWSVLPNVGREASWPIAVAETISRDFKHIWCQRPRSASALHQEKGIGPHTRGLGIGERISQRCEARQSV
jgi:hypothetical protein